jgi:hypothetical protein
MSSSPSCLIVATSSRWNLVFSSFELAALDAALLVVFLVALELLAAAEDVLAALLLAVVALELALAALLLAVDALELVAALLLAVVAELEFTALLFWSVSALDEALEVASLLLEDDA